MIKIGDTVSYSGLVDPDQDDDNITLTEYGIVVCVFPSEVGGFDAYVAFTGFEPPQSIDKQPEKPYILRYNLQSLQKVEI